MKTISRRAGYLGAILLASICGAAQAADTKEVHRTVALDKDGRVEIKTYKGSIHVTTWDRPEVSVDASIGPDGDGRYQKEKIALTEVRVTGSGRSVSIESDYDEAKRHQDGFFGVFFGDSGTLPFVRYTIRMPAGAKLEIDDYKSETEVSGLKADLKLHTYKGTAHVAELDGAARVDTYKGDVRVEFARFSRGSRFETYKGEIHVAVPKDSRFEFDGATDRGEIRSDFAMSRRDIGRWHRGERMRGSVNGGGPELTFESRRGMLRLRQI